MSAEEYLVVGSCAVVQTSKAQKEDASAGRIRHLDLAIGPCHDVRDAAWK
jgi:hypothetical protein